MPATISVTCPACGKVMNAPEVLRGKKIRCKGCDGVVTVGTPAAAAAAPAVPAPAAPAAPAAGHSEEWGVVSAYGMTKDVDKPRCPFCAIDLEEGQADCLRCGYNLVTRERHEPKVLEPVTPGEYFVWLLPGMFGFLGVLLCVGGLVIVWTGVPDLSDIGFRWTQDWRWGRVYATCFLGFVMWSCGVVAVKRLIYNPHPPEEEKAKGEGDFDDDD